MTTALITGGSSGIGLGFARRFAAEGHDLVLVARDQPRLDRTAVELQSRYGVHVDTISADLATVEGCDLVEKHLGSAVVDILVNNAGHALPQPYPRGALADEERMLDLLVRAPLRLTHAAIPGMTARGHGAILNVASVAGLLPAGTYGAAKAWLIHFSESLRLDLAPRGVRVLAVCPGFTHTGAPHIDTIPDWIWLSVDQVVDQAMKDLRRRRPRSVAGRHFKLYATAVHHAPRRLAARMARSRTPKN
ncbi:SDR family NAD(P)-dependent oxidoreductase [Streptomyces radicis]|uniref:SDR family NAD(P)-dependent oxidoreductase n=1 Tax=Streptomyces radicis TaxID=1750517 RepID=A0A3A9WCX6_9ACTN|nr:SDR family NAD(P)-dependent oxidoreductase [Streptomyces radicis]RKN05496.1 SDR family NAD(P)-dependent oxidoreductase [Streptomyces radicis]RKN17365.1 SDR family NAD(P)-dependent oxidoreductase [Streptomyces radicis]